MPDGHSVVVHGTNGAGKTTLADAWYWLLFGTDSKGKGDFDIKPKGGLKRGQVVDVRAEIDLGGRNLVLRRAMKENWVSPRGASAKVLRGNKTSFEVDGVPDRTARAWRQEIDEIMPAEKWRLLSDPAAFADDKRWTWKARRELLIEICGGVEDAEVIASDPELGDLPILGQRSIEDHRSVLLAAVRVKTKDRHGIPMRIAEVTRLMVELPACGEKQAKTDLNAVILELVDWESDQEGRKRRMDLMSASLCRLRVEIAEEEASAARAQAEKHGSLRSAAIALDDTARADAQCLKIAQGEQVSNRELLEAAKDVTSNAVADVSDVAACASCGQELPRDQAETRQSWCDKRLAECRALHCDLDADRVSIRDRVTAAEGASRASAEAQKNAMELLEGLEKPGDSERLLIKRAEEARARKDLDAMGQGNERGEIDSLRRLIQAHEATVDAFAAAKAQTSRVDELKAEEKLLSEGIENAERGLYLIDKFATARVRLLEERINSKFDTVSFVMFKGQVNGGIEERCDVEVAGVRYGNSLNRGGEVLAGLEIIGVLQGHFDFAPPVWVDGRESLVKLPIMDCQVISLRVSEDDQQLRIERVGK